MRLAFTMGELGLAAALREEASKAGHEVLCFGVGAGLEPLTGVRDCSVAFEQVESVRYLLTSFRADVFVHLGWSPVPDPRGDASDRDGLDLAGKLFQMAYEANVKHVVGLGTCQEYGPRMGQLPETTECLPVSRFGLMRQVAHGILCGLASEHAADYTWLRAFELVGGGSALLPCADPNRPSNAPVAPTTSDSARRDFLDVRDGARAVLHVIENRMTGPVNLCQGPVCTREELLRAIAVGARDRGIAGDRFQMRHGAQWIGDPARLSSAGFRPERSSAHTLADSILAGYETPRAFAA